MAAKFINHLPYYFLAWPCEPRVAALDQFGWVQVKDDHSDLVAKAFVAMKPPNSHVFNPLNCNESDYALQYKNTSTQHSSSAGGHLFVINLIDIRVDKDAQYNGTYCLTFTDINAPLLLVEYLAMEAKNKKMAAEFQWIQIRESITA